MASNTSAAQVNHKIYYMSQPNDRKSGHFGDLIYGVQVKVSRTGELKVSQTDKNKVANAAGELQKRFKNVMHLEIGYYLAVSGDAECCHDEYSANKTAVQAADGCANDSDDCEDDAVDDSEDGSADDSGDDSDADSD